MSDMNKLAMPTDQMVERCMTPEQRDQRQRDLARWRAEEEETDDGA